jgi:hypothetical protein
LLVLKRVGRWLKLVVIVTLITLTWLVLEQNPLCAVLGVYSVGLIS